ncbi:LAGLIDADG family homing endonuclease [Candidatus Pacearchaeota archaeon]|nr:LAGLIDADG family homing endonuclease [Candidatus Pacearchaeota archaeon]
MIYRVDLPKKWDRDLAYFFGLLLGDGSLPICNTKRPNGNYQKRHLIYFWSNSKDFLEQVYIPLFERLFGLTLRLERLKHKTNPFYVCRIESKEIYLFLEKKGFTVGKKAKIAKIPKLPKKYHLFLLAGLLDTDGGKKGNGFGLSTASDHLAAFCENIFLKLKLPCNSCPWKYHNHIYHQVYVPGKSMGKILKSIPIQNKDKISYLKSK